MQVRGAALLLTCYLAHVQLLPYSPCCGQGNTFALVANTLMSKRFMTLGLHHHQRSGIPALASSCAFLECSSSPPCALLEAPNGSPLSTFSRPRTQGTHHCQHVCVVFTLASPPILLFVLCS